MDAIRVRDGDAARRPRRFDRLLCTLLAFLALAGSAWIDPALATQVVASDRRSYLVRDDGTLWAWGWNDYGQLGDGTTTSRSAPILTMNGVRTVSGGLLHTIALKLDGTVWASGFNNSGQLGNGSTAPRYVPVQVMSGAIAIAAGQFHSLALKGDGTLWAWGENTHGQLGDGTTQNRLSPVQVLTGVVAVGAGFHHSLAITSDGTLWAWGRNHGGQLGDGTTTNRLAAVPVLANATMATGGQEHTLALKSDGTLWAWGINTWGQVGDSTTTNRLTPVQVLSGVESIAAGFDFSMAVKSDQTLWNWGSNGVSQLGNDGGVRLTPTQAFTGIRSASAKVGHVLALAIDGSVLSWGDNVSGQLGDGVLVDRGFPALTLTGVRAVAAGYEFNLAVKTDNTLWAWGNNESGQLANGTSTTRFTPAQVMTDVQSIAAGGGTALAIKTDATLWGWGENGSGQLGDGTKTSRNAVGQLQTGVMTAAIGYQHTLVVRTDGTLLAMGSNQYGQLGDGTKTERLAPVQVMTGVQKVAAPGYSSVALKADGTVWTWGMNLHGQLGDGTRQDRSTPQQILSDVKAISGASLHVLALKNDGSLWAWGYGGPGQLGTGNNMTLSTPQLVMTGVAAIAAAGYRSLAIKTDGTVWGWGEGGGWGGANANRPGQIYSLRDAAALAAGKNHSVVLTTDGRVFAWGGNVYGQLAEPRVQNSSTPLKIRDPHVPIAGSTIVWEFYNALVVNGAGTQGAGHYFMTADAPEAAFIDAGGAGAGWERTGRVFRAWLTAEAAPPGAAGVCRFYARGPNSHFYTADPGECAALKAANPANDPGAGWAYESIAFYTVLPELDPNPPPVGSIARVAGNGKCRSGYQPVYRVYNNRFHPDPALNDSNHRMTPSISDAYRAKTYLGYNDEGVAFCSPISDDMQGGDYQAYYLYPGADGSTGAALKTAYVFGNNGASRGDGALVYMVLPPEIASWSVTCAAYLGASCPATLDANRLREGVAVPNFPAGGFIVLDATGTAPANPGAQTYAAAVSAPGGGPDYLSDNNVPVASQMAVKSPVVCAWLFNPTDIALGNTGQQTQSRIATGATCRWSVASSETWLTPAVASGTGDLQLPMSASPNTGATQREATLTLTGLDAGGQPVAGSARALKVTQIGTPVAPVDEQNIGCISAWLTRDGGQFSSDGITGPARVTLIADATCAWTAKSNVPWVSVIEGSSGSGNRSIKFQVAANPGEEVRVGTLDIAGNVYTVTQMGTAVNKGAENGGCGGTAGCGESGGDGGGGGGGGDGGSSGGSSGGDSG